MSDTTWDIRLYDRFGVALNTNYSGYSDSGITNQVAHATDRQMYFTLNGVDTLNFSVYLDDPIATQISRLATFVKVWRTVPGYFDPTNEPCFAGIVGNHQKVGSQGIMRVGVLNPFWRLQMRFHLNNHYLKTDPETGQLYRQSNLIWRLISFLSAAFVGANVSYTGIDKGTFYDLASEIVMAPYFQPKGANSWSEIFDGILARAGSIDLIPRYSHTSGSQRLMYLDTALKRGLDKSSTVSFNYRFEPSNLDDITETVEVVPGKFGNYVWAVGAGGPNSGRVAVAGDASPIGDGYDSIGVYMANNSYPDYKRIGLGPEAEGGPTHLRAVAWNDLARSINPDTRYDAVLSPAATIYYGKDFEVGDVIKLNMLKGALNTSNVKQRIYECGLSISDNNIEVATPRIANDFFGKVVT